MYRIATAVTAGMLVAALAAGTSALGRSTPPSGASVDAKVVRQIAAHGQTTFWVVLREQANLSPARSMRPAPRGRYVYDTLTATANRTQRSLKAYLRQAARAVRVLLDPERDSGHGRQHGSPGARRAPGGGQDHPGRRLQDPAGCPGHPGADPEHRGVGRRPDQRTAGLVDVQRSRREHRRRQRRHRCPLHPRRARREVPRQPGGRQLRPQLQLVGPLCRVRGRGPRATTTATARTRWARWSATTATPARTRSASPRTRRGSRPRAARPTAARPTRSCRRASSWWRRPTSTARTRSRTCDPTSSATRGATATGATPSTRRSSRPGSRPGSSRRSRAGTRGRAAERSGRPGATPRATRSDRSTSTT